MATDYISREAAVKSLCKACGVVSCDSARCSYFAALQGVFAADVRPVDEISDAVDEVLDFLNENYNCMPYHIYSALFDLVSGICPNCGADMHVEHGKEDAE